MCLTILMERTEVLNEKNGEDRGVERAMIGRC